MNSFDPLFVGRPNIGDRAALLARIGDMLDRRWFTNNGPLVQEFECRVAAFVGVKHCVAMCNATVALEIASRALGLVGEVIVPSFTFIATAHALHWQGIRPVFADLDPATHNINPAGIEALITSQTTGIIGVHVWGRACDIDAIAAIAQRHGLQLMFDAAHALGCSHHGRMIGGFGRCEVFSFHATKFINSFEGGAVTTNDDDLAERMRLMRNFGFQGFDNVIYPGINGKMSEVCAAMGLTSLEAVDQIVAINRSHFAIYRERLSSLRGISVIECQPEERHNYQYVVIEIEAESAGLDRDALVAALHTQHIMARKYFWPGCHRMEPYRTSQPDVGRRLPHTEQVAARVVVLPTGQMLDADRVNWVCDVIEQTIRGAITA